MKKLWLTLFGWALILSTLSSSLLAKIDGESSLDESLYSESLNSALLWVGEQQDVSGAVSLNNNLATDFQSTAETIVIFDQNPNFSINESLAIEWLESNQRLNTDFLVRKILALKSKGVDVSELVEEILSRQNYDGGFGDYHGYSSTALNTASALSLFTTINYFDSSVLGLAVGYLIDQQNNDGDFSLSISDPDSILVTAESLQALTPYKYRYNIQPNIDLSVSYLQGALNKINDEIWLSALVLDSLLSHTVDFSDYKTDIDKLLLLQSNDGSWDNDVFVTLSVISLLNHYLNAPAPEENYGSNLSGVILESGTKNVLENAIVTISSNEQVSTTSLSDGTFEFSGLEAGNYLLSVGKTGYLTANLNLTIPDNQNVNIGSINLTEFISTPTLGGVVSSLDGSAIESVDITINDLASGDSLQLTTNNNGIYQTDISVGNYSISFEKDGYKTLTFNVSFPTVSNFIMSPSLQLVSDDTPLKTLVSGALETFESNMPISNAQFIINGTEVVSNLGNDGKFELEIDTQGSIQMIIQSEGYKTQTLEFIVVAGSNNQLGVVNLLTEITETTLTGRLIDSDTDELLSLNGTVTLVGDGSTYTSTNGQFIIENIGASEFTIEIFVDGYYKEKRTITWADSSAIDVEIEMHPITVNGLFSSNLQSEQNSYGAFKHVSLTADFINNSEESQSLQMRLIVENQDGSYKSIETIAHGNTIGDKIEDTILELTSQLNETINFNWNTLNLAPGTYQLTLIGEDTASLEDRVKLSTQITILEDVNLASGTIVATPGYAVVGAEHTLDIFFSTENRSNIAFEHDLHYEIKNPSGEVIHQNDLLISLSADKVSNKNLVDRASILLDTAGEYSVEFVLQTPHQADHGVNNVIYVAPTVRLEAEQSLNTNDAFPSLSSEFNLNIQINGFSQDSVDITSNGGDE